MPGPSSLNPTSHPYSNPLYYPGHSCSPYITSRHLQHLKLRIHTCLRSTLWTPRGGRVMRLCIVLLRHDESDTRVQDMRMSLYPGAVLEFSSTGYVRRQIDASPLRPLIRARASSSSQTSLGALSLDVSSVHLKSGYPMPTSGFDAPHVVIGDPVTETEVDTEMEEIDSQRGWWRHSRDWGCSVKDDRKEALEAAIEERLTEFLELME
ncbi:hypothetical protein IAT40_001511 [Kwoniella sp. CBS 6097]